jgi:hypothetical protein
MKLNFILTRLQASIENAEEKFFKDYETFTDDSKFWCMIDLVNSSNYRLLKGPKLGYVRGATFFSLVQHVISFNSKVRLIKEMGDAVLLTSDSLRPLLESVILINQIAYNLKVTQQQELYPFDVRCGFSFGTVKRLFRANEDFLGSSIDELARIMSIRSSSSNIYIQEEAYRSSDKIVEEYNSFLSISDPIKFPPKDAKNMIKDIIYREVNIDLENFLKYSNDFVDWRK